ncbi:MAG: hypothetical protein JWM90_876 [Thermoleophilia bacterium]|nr:hypothetical protein [Thermoleophilia bacterium]
MHLSAPITVAAAEPLRWNPSAGRNAHRLPTDHVIEVGDAKLKFSPGWTDPAYRFTGGIAQAARGAELFVEAGGPFAADGVLTDLRRALDEVPQPMLDGVNQIRVLARQDEAYDRYFAKAYGIPGFQAAAAGGGGTITFFGGKPYSTGTLFHELAHNLGVGGWSGASAADDAVVASLLRTGTLRQLEFEPIPDPARRARWTPRLAPGAVTPYGQSATGEDIAEGMRLIMSESHFGHAFAQHVASDGTVRELPFGEIYPNRTAALERAARTDLDRDGTIGS